MEPVGKSLRRCQQQLADIIGRSKLIIHHLCVVRPYFAVILAEQYVIKFIFSEAVIKFSAIGKAEDLLQLAIKPHFFPEPAMRCREHVFIREGVAAAGIGPQTAGVIFVCSPLLQKQLTFGVDDKY